MVLALHLEPAHLRPALAILTDALLPVQLQVRSDRADADRGLVLVRKPGGSGWLLSRAELNAECGERLWTVLQAELGTDPDNPADTAAAAAAAAAATAGRPEEAPAELYGGAGPRTLAQRGHDALNTALGRLLDSGVLGQRGQARPAHRGHGQPGRPARPTRRAARDRRLRSAPAQRPGTPLAVRQRPHPLRHGPGPPGRGKQPHGSDAHPPRTPTARRADRRPVPDHGMPTPTRPAGDPAPHPTLGPMPHHQHPRHRSAVRPLPPRPSPRPGDPAPTRRQTHQ